MTRTVGLLAVMAVAFVVLGVAGGLEASAEPRATDPQEQVEERTDALVEELGRALGMTPAEIEALGMSPAEMRRLLAGFTEETVVVGSRAQPRSATASAVPVDVLSATDLVSQGAGDLKDQLRTIIPSFNTNTQPISGGSTVVRPAMLRNLAPDHTLVLVNGRPRISCKSFTAIGLLATWRPRFPRRFPLWVQESTGPSKPPTDLRTYGVRRVTVRSRRCGMVGATSSRDSNGGTQASSRL